MAWIAPAVLGIVSMISQNAQNKAAAKNNTNQQAAGMQNAMDARNWAQGIMQPWTQPQNSPAFGVAPQRPTQPMSMGAPQQAGIPGYGTVNASSLLGAQQPQMQPTALNPAMLQSIIARIMQPQQPQQPQMQGAPQLRFPQPVMRSTGGMI